MSSSRRYPPELRERAVRMVAEISDSTTRSGRRSVRSRAARGRQHRNGAQVGGPARSMAVTARDHQRGAR